MSSSSDQRFISPGQAAKRLHVSRATVSRALLAGELPGIRNNSGRWKIAESDLSAWRKAVDIDHNTAHEQIMLTDHEQENQSLRAQISELREQLHQAELRYVRLEASSITAAQAAAQQITDLNCDRDRWYALAVRPAPTLFERIRSAFSSKSGGA